MRYRLSPLTNDGNIEMLPYEVEGENLGPVISDIYQNLLEDDTKEPFGPGFTLFIERIE